MKTTLSLGQALTIVTGKVLCPMGDVYAAAKALTGQQDIFTNQLCDAVDACKAHLLEHLPALAGIDGSGVTPDNALAFLAEQSERHGDVVLAPVMPPGRYVPGDPVEQLRRAFPGDRTAVIVAPDPQDA